MLSQTGNFKIFNSVDEIGKDSIESLYDNDFHTYRWLKTEENTQLYKSQLYKLDPFYVTIFNRNELVALAPFFLARLRSQDYYSSRKKNCIIKDKILALSSLFKLPLDRALISNSPFLFRSKILVEKSYNGSLALKQISKIFDFLCHKNKLLFSSFLSVPEDDRLLISNLEDLGYQKFLYGISSYLDIEWKSFDEYLERRHGSNQGSGHSIRREIRKCEENGVKIGSVQEFGELSETLSRLHTYLYLKHYKQKSPYDPAFYQRLNEFAKDNIKLFVARKNGEAVGFSCCFKQGETLDVHHCGFNYEALGKKDYTYFNLCYYTPIKWSIENGIKRIIYGSTLPDLKRRRGCKDEKMFAFIKLQNSVPRNLARPLIAWTQKYPIARFLL